MRCAWLAALVACSAPAPPPAVAHERPIALEDDDVAILFPLAARDRGYLSPASRGAGGDLVPREIYLRAFGPPGTLMLGGTPAAPALAGLRAVALRLDPCFAALPPIDDTRCQPQLRLVFQTLIFDGRRTIADDDAVHAFYALGRAELETLAGEIAALRHRSLGPLAPHPILVEEGLDGELGTALSRLVLGHAGARNLTRLTLITSSGLGRAWNFAGVDLAGGEPTPIAIAGLPDVRVEGFFAGFSPDALAGDPAITPAPHLAPRDDLRLLASAERAARAPIEERHRALAAAVRIESPDVHAATTIDCASCHVAQTVRTGAAEVDVHMFGYKGAAPSIQQRTRNEVAATLAYLRRR